MARNIHFYSGPGLKLSGHLSLSRSKFQGTGGWPGVVLCHGPNGARGVVQASVVGQLTGHGYAALTFHHRGFGESQGPEHRLLPPEQVEDIRQAVTWLQSQPGVDPTRIGVWGAATGAANACFAAAVDARIKCSVSVSAAGDGERWLRDMRRYWEWLDFKQRVARDAVRRALTGESERVATGEIIVSAPDGARHAARMVAEGHFPATSYLTLESAAAMMAFKPETVVHRISPRAAMWICAAADRLVPPEESARLYQLAREPKRLVVIEGSHHELYRGAGFEAVIEATLDWFREYL